MAKRRGLAPQHDEHVNVTPLIDIVMCLIIFFMICGKLVQADVTPLEIPKAKKAQELEDQKNRLFINLLPDYFPEDLKIAVDNPNHLRKPIIKLKKTPVVEVHGERMPMEKDKDGNDQFSKRFVDLLRKEKQANPDMRLLIRADRDLHYRYISPLIVSCAKADIKSIHFATDQEGSSSSE